MQLGNLPKEVAEFATKMTIPQAIKNLSTAGFNPMA